jgi:hypothetical protein
VRRELSFVLRGVGGLLWLFAVGPTLAQEGGPGWYGHRVHLGDTLIGVAQTYLQRPGNWRGLQRYNDIAEPRHLMPGTTLRIPVKWLRTLPSTVKVIQAVGDVSAASQNAAFRPVVTGMALEEGVQIRLADGAHLTLRAVDGSTIWLMPGADARLARVREVANVSATQTIVNLLRGRVDSKVSPQKAGGQFKVQTLVALAGVRGTEFSASLDPGRGFTSEVREGRIEVAAGQASRRDAHAAASVTEVDAGYGVRVPYAGARPSVKRLLPAPDLSGLPAVYETASLDVDLVAQPGADAYMVRLASDADAVSVIRSGAYPATGRPLRARLGSVADGRYFLVASATDADGLEGMRATRSIEVNAQPEPPLIRAPAPGGKIESGTVEFMCAQRADIQTYRIQVTQDKGRPDQLGDIQSGRCAASLSLRPGVHYWRVAAIAQEPRQLPDQGPFSSWVEFEVLTPAPSLRVAAAGAGVTISWKETPHARYRIQLSRNDTFSSVAYEEILSKSQFSSDSLEPGSWYVRLQQIDAAGVAGAFSPISHIEVDRPLVDSQGARVTRGDHQPIVLDKKP